MVRIALGGLVLTPVSGEGAVVGEPTFDSIGLVGWLRQTDGLETIDHHLELVGRRLEQVGALGG